MAYLAAQDILVIYYLYIGLWSIPLLQVSTVSKAVLPCLYIQSYP